MGCPLARTGWGTPQPRLDGVTPPHLGQDGVHPGTGYAWTGYAADGTPLVVFRRRTVLAYKVYNFSLLNFHLNNIRQAIKFSSNSRLSVVNLYLVVKPLGEGDTFLNVVLFDLLIRF